MTQSINRHNPHSIRGPHFPVALPKVDLEIIRGRAHEKMRSVSDATFLFGSGKECDLVLGDPQFPEVHGYLLVTPEGVSIRHLGLEPVLTVEGQPVSSAVLKNNDRIRTGPYEFRLHLRWARGENNLHLPREVVSNVPGRRIDLATEQVAHLLDDIEQELSADQRLKLFVGGEEHRCPEGGENEPSPVATKKSSWKHMSQTLTDRVSN